jgi:phage shock protein E
MSNNQHSLENIIHEGAFLVDVREPSELLDGSVKGAVNIPLGTVESNLEQFKNKQNIVVFCRSGNRSGQAKMILNHYGFNNVINGGTWYDVNQLVK